MGMPPAIIEKDFWVTYMLNYLFHRCSWQDRFVFKGGTSLSKAYQLIERFSEDIDLILDWRLLGYKEKEPWEERSNTQQDKFNKISEEKTIGFLNKKFIPAIKRDILQEIQGSVDIFLEKWNEPTVVFAYPQIFSDVSILQVIRLEIGALAAWSPSQDIEITSFAAEYYPQVFSKKSTVIRTAVPERTFWEKVTILHREANRKEGRFPERYSRHYYDLYKMAMGSVKEKAFSDLNLLKSVVDFKKKFYRCSWANYDEAFPGSMKLIPPERYFADLQNDYEKMRNMIYGEKPPFEEIILTIKNLQTEINNLNK